MANCRLTASINKESCGYSLAGVRDLYLINLGDAAWEQDAETKEITAITLPASEKAYKIDFIQNTASFSDELAENGNGGKYRTHTVNFSIADYSYQVLNQGDALSMGRFVAVAVDTAGRAVVLGRHNGLNATAFNYESGAADADANGWTVTMVSSEIEIAPLLKDASVIESVSDKTKVVA